MMIHLNDNTGHDLVCYGLKVIYLNVKDAESFLSEPC